MEGDTFYSVTDQSDGKRQDAMGMVTIVPKKADQGKEHVCYVRNPATINPLWVKTHLEVLCKQPHFFLSFLQCLRLFFL